MSSPPLRPHRWTTAVVAAVAMLVSPLALTAHAAPGPDRTIQSPGAAKPSLELRVPRASSSGAATPVLLDTTGLATGTKAVVQANVKGGWRTVATGVLPATGILRLSVKPTLGATQYRAQAGNLTSATRRTLAAPKVSTTQAVKRQKVTVSGIVPDGRKRQVRLQVKTKKKWKTVATRRSAASGAAKFSIRLTKGAQVRISAPRAGKRKPFTSSAVRVAVGAQGATLNAPQQAYLGEAITLTARFAPRKLRRPVQAQVRKGSRWATVATAAQDAKGRVSFSLDAPSTGTHQYRLVAKKHKRTPAFTTATRAVVVDQLPLIISEDTRPLTQAEADALVAWDEAAGVLTYDPLPESLADVTAGSLLTVPPSDAAPAGLLRRVTGVTTTGTATQFATTDASVVDLIESAPQDMRAFAVEDGGPMVVTDVAEGVDVLAGEPEGAAGQGVKSAVVTGPRLSLDVDSTLRWSVPISGERNAPEVAVTLNSKGLISAAPTGDFELGTTWYGKPNRYKLGGGFDWNNALTNKVTIDGELDKKKWDRSYEADGETVDLLKFDKPLRFMIGPVPVYVSLVGKLIAEYKVTAGGGVKFQTTWVGRSVAGVQNTSNDSMSPDFYATEAKKDVKLLSVYGEGKAQAFAGAEFQVMLYGLAGPYGKLGLVGRAEMALDSQQLLTCAVKAGIGGEYGMKTSDGLKKLTGLTFTPYRKEYSIGGLPRLDVKCPYFSDPEIATESLPGGVVGEPYSQVLTVEDGRKGTWAVTSGALPRGLTLTSSGLLHGTPTLNGRKVFRVTFTDDQENTAEKSFTIVVTGDADDPDDPTDPDDPAPIGDGDVLVFGDSDNGFERDNMVAVLESQGFKVDVSATVPEEISQYQSIWEIEAYQGFDEEEASRVVDYVKAGGSLYMTGERPCCEELNDSVESVLDQVLFDEDVTVGDAGDSESSEFLVNPNAADGLAHNPNVLEYFHPDAPGRLQSAALQGVDSRNVFVRGNAGDVVAAAWRDNDMVTRKGRIVVIMDIDYLGRPYEEYSKVIENVVTFLNRG